MRKGTLIFFLIEPKLTSSQPLPMRILGGPYSLLHVESLPMTLPKKGRTVPIILLAMDLLSSIYPILSYLEVRLQGDIQTTEPFLRLSHYRT